MLEKPDLTKKISKAEYRERMDKLVPVLGKLQRQCREKEIPVMIAFEGCKAAEKGVQIGKLIQGLDPRGFEVVYALKKESEEERLHPFLWRFWCKLPQKGQIAIYDSSWCQKPLAEYFDDRIKKQQLSDAYESICSFEEQLTDDGMVLIKIFLSMDSKKRTKRLGKMLLANDTYCAPWNVVETEDQRTATMKIYEIVTGILTEKLEEAGSGKKSILSGSDLTLSYSKEEYRKKLERLQKKIGQLHKEIYRRRIPVVLGFEGWDAGGKGGAIKRLTEKMDPRGYVVHPTASPNAIEKRYHYLWRFWTDMPKAGHITIFDRTWYGRVMVERIEGFCTAQEWQRAYKEINAMERDLTRSGAIVLKFWMQIDKEEQERRFKAREEDPEKQWKITDEDWRNREKWKQYEEAVDEMLIRTSTPEAPWIIVEGNCKYYARIKVLETVVVALEKRLEEE